MADKLYQMNISYVPKEDRLLLKISTKNSNEYRLWLTRRFSGLLINVLNKEITNRGGSSSIASSKITTRMFKDGAFEKSYEGGNVTFPLGESGILAYKINAGNNKDGDLQLELSPEQGQGLTVNLNKSLLYMFHNLLAQGVEQSGWGPVSIETASMKLH
ncbi:MAG: hypothetical protein O6928_01615 [Gammaproteobacteria bacterium]|nr:hypothetical protein [Gammaproteobacteria bacterium]